MVDMVALGGDSMYLAIPLECGFAILLDVQVNGLLEQSGIQVSCLVGVDCSMAAPFDGGALPWMGN